MPSSVVAAFKYNTKAKALRVNFVSGAVYEYKNVPEEVYDEMKNAPSKGTFLNTVIKRNFGYKKIR